MKTTHPSLQSLRLAATPSAARRTPRQSFGSAMHQGLVGATRVAQQGLAVAAPALPGGFVASAALAGLSGPSLPVSAANPQLQGQRDLVQLQTDSSLQLIALQQRIQEETRAFTMTSNVLKARHDAAKNAVGNMR
ncbi:MAG: hypothetical protein AAGD10_00860 [Myxococcota bacterium]